MRPADLRRSARVLVGVAVALASFAIGYLARGLDPEFSEWLDVSRASNGLPFAGARLRFDATAYCKGTTTASGVNVRTGIAAADPTLLPVGSVVNVATGDVEYSGVYTIMDTGPKVQGRLLDLYMWSCHKALAFGRKGVDVTVLRLGWNPQASSPTLIDRLFQGREARRRIPPPEPPPPAGLPPADGTPIEEEAAASPPPAEEFGTAEPVVIPADPSTPAVTPGSPPVVPGSPTPAVPATGTAPPTATQ
jgi:3D (Asp-Asp-Asp) domain-containing protein